MDPSKAYFAKDNSYTQNGIQDMKCGRHDNPKQMRRIFHLTDKMGPHEKALCVKNLQSALARYPAQSRGIIII
tara:strand:+ start:2962 stop:3180 length:219 start_codon:yes stop_codon:yes gene_type:complete